MVLSEIYKIVLISFGDKECRNKLTSIAGTGPGVSDDVVIDSPGISVTQASSSHSVQSLTALSRHTTNTTPSGNTAAILEQAVQS